MRDADGERMSNLEPHKYQGLGHMCHPDDFYPCCEHPARHPIHDIPLPRTCGCDRYKFRHLHGKGCPA